MVAPLCERHRARVVPGVDHLGDAGRLLPALGALERDLVDRRPMRVDPVHVATGPLGQLGERADEGVVVIGAPPDRQRRSPVAFARKGPVDVVLEPVAVPAVADVLGVPVHLLVDLQEPLLHRGGSDVPGRPSDVHQRRVTPPAQRIGVGDRLCADQQAAGAQVLDDRGIRVLEEAATNELGSLVGEPSLPVDRLERRPALLAADLEVLGAERRRHVDDPGAVVQRHEVRRDHPVRALHVRVQGLVARSFERRPRDRLPHDRIVGEHGILERLREDQAVAVVLHHDVGSVGGNRDARVRDERPRRGGPAQQRGADERGVGRLDDRERDEHARVLDVGVARRDLGVGQGRPAPRAVGGDPVRLDEQATRVQLLQGPPHALDVLGVHRPVRVVRVDPEAEPFGLPFELSDVPLDGLAAEPVELGDAERLDVALGLRPDLLLDLELDRQTVAVPAGLARHVVAGHRLEAGVDVLEGPGLRVMDRRASVRRRRTLVERPERSVLALLELPMEDVGLAPEPEHALLELRETDLRIDRFEHRTSETRKRPVPCRDGARCPAVPPRVAGPSRNPAARRSLGWERVQRATVPATSRCHGRARPRLLGVRGSHPVGAAARGGCSEGRRRRARTVPGSLGLSRPPTRSRHRL